MCKAIGPGNEITVGGWGGGRDVERDEPSAPEGVLSVSNNRSRGGEELPVRLTFTYV